jgi:deazaflavin-dependent oxidoreductase (nitroreductase family)
MLRRGIGVGPQRLLSVPGRTTRILRTTPVAVIALDGERYIVAGFETSDWVKNVRAAGWATIGRGRKSEQVDLVEVAPDKRVPILRAFAQKVRGGRVFLTVAANASDMEFVAASSRHPVFRVVSIAAASTDGHPHLG